MFHYYSYFTISVSFRCLTFESFFNINSHLSGFTEYSKIFCSLLSYVLSSGRHVFPVTWEDIHFMLPLFQDCWKCMYITCFGMAVGWLFKMYIVFGEITQSEWAERGLWKRRGGGGAGGTQDFSWLWRLRYGGKCNTAYCNLCRPRIVALYLQSNGFVSVQAETSIVFFRWYIFNIWNISVTTQKKRFDVLQKYFVTVRITPVILFK